MAQPTSSALRALALEYKSLQEEPVEGFRVKLVNEDNMFEWEVAIFGPPDTLYQGGYFKVNSFLLALLLFLAVSLLLLYPFFVNIIARSSLFYQKKLSPLLFLTFIHPRIRMQFLTSFFALCLSKRIDSCALLFSFLRIKRTRSVSAGTRRWIGFFIIYVTLLLSLFFFFYSHHSSLVFLNLSPHKLPRQWKYYVLKKKFILLCSLEI